jgi:hypothetical protein
LSTSSLILNDSSHHLHYQISHDLAARKAPLQFIADLVIFALKVPTLVAWSIREAHSAFARVQTTPRSRHWCHTQHREQFWAIFGFGLFRLQSLPLTGFGGCGRPHR